MPRVTVLLPTCQSERYLRECVESVLAQSCGDFELLVVDDASTDDTLFILNSFRDSRIRIIQGRGQGLADALNQGLLQAKGEYIARIDADDLMAKERLAHQVSYMDKHPETAVCGSWQQYFGLRSFCHKPSASAAQCRANLLFRCDLCHSTLMLRRDFFLENKLFYDGRFAAEDFELWTRVLDHGNIENIPEVLGYYRDEGAGVTGKKMERLIREHGEIVAATLKRNLQIELTEEQKKYFPGWISPFHDPRSGIPPQERKQAREDLRRLFERILQRSQELKCYDETALRQTVAAEWSTLCCGETYRVTEAPISDPELFREQSISEAFYKKVKQFLSDYRGPRQKYIKIRSILRDKCFFRKRKTAR